MSCESCYNGCIDVVSDQCVRYTGLDNVPLDIQSGDNLQTVLDNIISRLDPLLIGEGDKITIASAIRCAIVNGYLPTPVGTNQWTSEQLFQTLVKVVCNLQTQITAIAADIAILNADYTTGCLTGVTSSSDTHAIVQAIINKLCATVAELAALELNVATNYVKLADLDALIAAYLASQGGGGSNQQYLKMVPFVAYEYYGSLINFDGTGAGLNSAGFYKVYLCNGLNGTPDKRGRVAVGAIANVPPVGVGLDSAVDPANPGNPNYAIFNTAGENTVVLTPLQMPSHSHAAIASSTGTISPNPHSHNYSLQNTTTTVSGVSGGAHPLGNAPVNSTTSTIDLTVAISTGVTVSNTGGGGAHANIPPVIAAYYIMYIP